MAGTAPPPPPTTTTTTTTTVALGVAAFAAVAVALRGVRAWLSPSQRRVASALEGKAVVVTGAAGALGVALCEAVAAAGARRVVMWDVDAERLSAAAERVRARATSAAFRVETSKVDVREHASVVEAAAKVLDGGAPDVVINNAGLYVGGYVGDTPVAAFRTMMDVNYFASVWTTLAFLDKMEARGSGHIVNVASLMAVFGSSSATGYSASKGALRSFSDALNAELRHRHSPVRVSVVLPYAFQSEMFRGIAMPFYALGPVTPATVANDVLAVAVAGKAQVVVSPTYMQLACLASGFFAWLGLFTPIAHDGFRQWDKAQAERVRRAMASSSS